MNSKVARKSKVGPLLKEDYLSPLPLPTGELPADSLNIIWRKNNVFMDVGYYCIASGVMVMWPSMMLCLWIAYITNDPDVLLLGGAILSVPIALMLRSLFVPVPLPIRFNRQRREVCVSVAKGEYWVVPWETVTAMGTESSTINQAGKQTQGLLLIGFTNPDPDGNARNKNFTIGFNCGGGISAMKLWECMRSYMEIGPDAVEDPPDNVHHPKGILATYWRDLVKAAGQKGWPLAIVWDGFFGIFIFNALLVIALERLKLNPPPELTWPEIVEWSKPIPPEQWAKRSPELEAAIAQREAELALRD